MKTRIIAIAALLCAILMLVSCANGKDEIAPSTTVGIPSTASGEDVTQGDYVYTVYRTWAQITSYTGKAKNLTLPENFDGKPILLIGEGAFRGCETLEKVTFPLTLRALDRYAFENCSALKEIVVNNRLETIADYAFRGSGIEVFAPDCPLYSIGRNVFYGCENLKKVVLPASLTVLKEYAFSGCTALTEVDMTACVRLAKLDNRLFNGCTSLQSFALPENLTEIASYCFAGCTAIESLTVPDSVIAVGEGAFNGTAISITAKAGSAAAKYALRNGTPLETLAEEEK